MDSLACEFSLDSRLANDCILVGDLSLCRLLLMNDAQYPWCILVPRRPSATEIYHLSKQDQQQLTIESAMLAEFLADHFAAKKMNIGALGNIVTQLHIHHVVRYEDDIAWPGPVWGAHPPRSYTPIQSEAICHQITVGLGDNLQPILR